MIVNIPLGQFTRVRLKYFLREQLKNLQTFETMLVAKATEQNVRLIKGLLALLEIDFKPKKNRCAAKTLTDENEKNLKPSVTDFGDEHIVNIIDLSVKFGLVVVLFLLAFHLNYLESHTL